MTRQETTAAIKAKVATLTWGTELETTGLGTAEAANVLARFFGTARQYRGGIYTKYEVRDQRGRKWACVTDASVTGSREGHAAEIVTPALDASEADFELVGQVAQALRRGGAKVDKTCGEHIHVGTYDTNGTERITFKQIANIVKLWAGKESLILDAFNVSEYRRINWCCPIDTQRGSSRSRGFLDQIRALRDFTSEAINRAWFGFYYASPDHYDETRYHSLNLNNVWRESRTIEFRIFNGTLNPAKIKARALFALHVAAAGCIKANTRISTPNMNGEQSRCYKMRCFLLDIGMIGEEYREARHEILRHLEGDTAWRTEEQRREHARRRRTADSRNDMEAENAEQRRAEREQEAQQNTAPETYWNAHRAHIAMERATENDRTEIAQIAYQMNLIPQITSDPTARDIADRIRTLYRLAPERNAARDRFNEIAADIDRHDWSRNAVLFALMPSLGQHIRTMANVM